METWIHTMAARASRRRVVAWLVVLGAVAIGVSAERRYLTNCLKGPFDLRPDELAQIRELSEAPRYYVRVTGSKAVDTGIQQVTVRRRAGVETSREVSAGYYVLVVGDRLLVTKQSGAAKTTVEGGLEPLSADLSQRLFTDPEMQAIRARFYPFYVDNDSFRLGAYIQLAVGLVLGFLAIRTGLPAWRRLKDPSSHPVVARAASWGDPLGAAVQAEREFGSPAFRGGGWSVGETYLISSTFFSFDVLRLGDLLWAYKSVTKHSVNFIPTGKTYAAVLACDGGTATVRAPEKKTDELLAFAASRVPWAVFGHSPELATLFKKNANDFCAAVEQRKQEWARKAAAAPS